MNKNEDLEAFRQAKNDITDQVEDFVRDNPNLGTYTEWLEAILEHTKSLRIKDFF